MLSVSTEWKYWTHHSVNRQWYLTGRDGDDINIISRYSPWYGMQIYRDTYLGVGFKTWLYKIVYVMDIDTCKKLNLFVT